MKKILALVIALMMVLATMSVFAQEKALDPADADNASITIMNPANGETYTLYKLFDATVDMTTATGDPAVTDNIAYQGTIPESLSAYFETITGADGSTDYVKLKDDADVDALFEALETWAESATATVSEESNGDETLAFTGLPYGYYVVLTTHKDTTTSKAAITVDSTRPNAQIYDKNETQIINEGKESNGESYSIGDTITYTAKFLTTNYTGSGADAKKVYKYVIEDTLPEFLSDVKITSITIGGDPWPDAPTTFTNKQITIPWVDATDDSSLYANGAEIVVTYTATLTSTVNVNAGNKNTISITPYDKDDEPSEEPFEESNEITTYAAAIKKTDGTKALAGAKFKAYGLTVEKTADGIYTVVSYDSKSTELGTEMSTDADGKLYIIGLGEDVKLSVVETEAPAGYNKLEDATAVPAQVLETEVYKESGTRYYDANGNLVAEESSSTTSKTVEKNLDELDAKGIEIVNEAGAQLPATGGIGTTIFYVAGSLMALAAAILLVTRRRMHNED